MTTIAQTIAARHLAGEGRGYHLDVEATGRGTFRNVALFFAAPFFGLGYAVVYAFVGLGAIACYGLKAVGIQCGVFKG